MIEIPSLSLPAAEETPDLRAAAAAYLRVPEEAVESVLIRRRSIDARKKPDIRFVYALGVVLAEGSRIRTKRPYSLSEEHRYAILQAEPCDPNILGLISDFFLAVDSVDICLVYSVLSFGTPCLIAY